MAALQVAMLESQHHGCEGDGVLVRARVEGADVVVVGLVVQQVNGSRVKQLQQHGKEGS